MTKEEIQHAFEDAFLAIPDADEKLLNKNTDGSYADNNVELYHYWFRAGVEKKLLDYRDEMRKITAWFNKFHNYCP